MNDKQKDLSIKEALHLFHQDGVVDLVAGATLLNFGFDVLNQAQSTSLFTWLPILLLSSIKNKNTFPRLESQLAAVDGKKRKLWTLIPAIVMIFTLVILSFLMLNNSTETFQIFVPASTGDLQSLAGNMALALICLIPAIWIGLKHFYIYSAVAAVLGIASFFFFPGQFSMFINGAVMIGIAIRNMMQFNKQFTIPEEPASDEN